MPKGRPSTGPQIQVNFRCPPDVLDAVREKIKDPVRNRTKHGDLSKLVVHLLTTWLGNDKLENL